MTAGKAQGLKSGGAGAARVAPCNPTLPCPHRPGCHHRNSWSSASAHTSAAPRHLRLRCRIGPRPPLSTPPRRPAPPPPPMNTEAAARVAVRAAAVKECGLDACRRAALAALRLKTVVKAGWNEGAGRGGARRGAARQRDGVRRRPASGGRCRGGSHWQRRPHAARMPPRPIPLPSPPPPAPRRRRTARLCMLPRSTMRTLRAATCSPPRARTRWEGCWGRRAWGLGAGSGGLWAEGRRAVRRPDDAALRSDAPHPFACLCPGHSVR